MAAAPRPHGGGTWQPRAAQKRDDKLLARAPPWHHVAGAGPHLVQCLVVQHDEGGELGVGDDVVVVAVQLLEEVPEVLLAERQVQHLHGLLGILRLFRQHAHNGTARAESSATASAQARHAHSITAHNTHAALGPNTGMGRYKWYTYTMPRAQTTLQPGGTIRHAPHGMLPHDSLQAPHCHWRLTAQIRPAPRCHQGVTLADASVFAFVALADRPWWAVRPNAPAFDTGAGVAHASRQWLCFNRKCMVQYLIYELADLAPILAARSAAAAAAWRVCTSAIRAV